jgi:hypothetical protein
MHREYCERPLLVSTLMRSALVRGTPAGGDGIVSIDVIGNDDTMQNSLATLAFSPAMARRVSASSGVHTENTTTSARHSRNASRIASATCGNPSVL